MRVSWPAACALVFCLCLRAHPAAREDLTRAVLDRFAAAMAPPAEEAFLRGLAGRSLASPVARDLARRLLKTPLVLRVVFAADAHAGLLGTARFEPGSLTRASLALDPRLRAEGDPRAGRAFWHEVCHAVNHAESDPAEPALYELLADDELFCYAAGELVYLELGGVPDMDETSRALAQSTAAFRAALMHREEFATLSWEELRDPVSAWRGRLSRSEAERGHCRDILARLPVWRYRIAKVAEAGFIAPQRLEGLSRDLVEMERSRGGLDDLERFEADLRERMSHFEGPDGPGILRRVSEYLKRDGRIRRRHEEMIVLQRRYGEKVRAFSGKARPEGKRAAGSAAAAALPAQIGARPPDPATWDELQQAYDRLRKERPGCCADEPPYSKPL